MTIHSKSNFPDNPTDPSASFRQEFTKIYVKHENDLMKLSRRLCIGNEERAQDLFQETVVKAYSASRERRLDATTAKAWMMRIMTNVFINEYRRNKKWDAGIDVETLTNSGETGPEQTHADKADVPGFRLLALTLDEELEDALAQLTEPLRLAVTLVDMQGLEYSEAALVLQVPIGTVRSRLARARMQLHDLLQEFAKKRGYGK